MVAASRSPRWLRLSVFWLVLYFMCLGLGYPTLARYDTTRTAGTTDAWTYHRIVESGPHPELGHRGYRLLVPYMAKPVYWLARGRVGAWNPVAFALLIVNSLFCATSALLLCVIGLRMSGSACGVIAAFAYLLNFNIANLQLSGLVDSAEGCALILVMWTLMTQRRGFLLLIGCAGALAKESFVPLAFAVSFTWLLAPSGKSREGLRSYAWVFAAALTGMFSVSAVRFCIDRHWSGPWSIALSLSQYDSVPGGILGAFLSCVRRWNVWFPLSWPLGLGLMGIRRVPAVWWWSSAASTAVALLLSVWGDAGPNASRPVFETLGPVTTVAAAAFLVDFFGPNVPQQAEEVLSE